MGGGGGGGGCVACGGDGVRGKGRAEVHVGVRVPGDQDWHLQSDKTPSLMDWNRQNDGSKTDPKMQNHGVAVSGQAPVTTSGGGGGGWHKALVLGSVGLWLRLLASRLWTFCHDTQASTLLRASALPRASPCLGGGGNPECTFCPWRPDQCPGCGYHEDPLGAGRGERECHTRPWVLAHQCGGGGGRGVQLGLRGPERPSTETPVQNGSHTKTAVLSPNTTMYLPPGVNGASVGPLNR